MDSKKIAEQESAVAAWNFLETNPEFAAEKGQITVAISESDPLPVACRPPGLMLISVMSQSCKCCCVGPPKLPLTQPHGRLYFQRAQLVNQDLESSFPNGRKQIYTYPPAGCERELLAKRFNHLELRELGDSNE